MTSLRLRWWLGLAFVAGLSLGCGATPYVNVASPARDFAHDDAACRIVGDVYAARLEPRSGLAAAVARASLSHQGWQQCMEERGWRKMDADLAAVDTPPAPPPPAPPPAPPARPFRREDLLSYDRRPNDVVSVTRVVGDSLEAISAEGDFVWYHVRHFHRLPPSRSAAPPVKSATAP